MNTTAAAKRYKSSVLKLAGMTLGMIFLSIFLGAMLVFALAKLFDVGYEALFVVLPIAMILAVVYTVLWRYCWVEVHPDRVVISNLRKKERSFPRQECSFTSNVVTHYTNGMATTKTRFLVVLQEQREIEILLPAISKREFDLLLAELRFAPHEIDKVVSEIEIDKTVFTIPQEQITKRYRRPVKIFAYSMGILGILMIVGMALLMANTDPQPGSEMQATGAITWTIVIALLLFFGFGIPVYMTYKNRVAKVPSQVTVDRTTLVVDNDKYNMSLIEQIVMTPPSYINDSFSRAPRSLVIYSRGKRKTYLFGDRKPVGKGAYTDYGEMCKAIEMSALVNKVPFLFDL